MALDNLPFNWFDLVFLAVLVLGVFLGRKNGMSKEVIPLLRWITVVIVCGLFYQPLGNLLAGYTGLDALAGYIIAYLVLGVAVYFIFTLIKNALNPKLAGSNLFGSSEYYLAMPAGLIRYFCLTLVVLALLHARFYSSADIRAQDAYAERWFGGGLYKGQYFPTLESMQEQVFDRSFSGRVIKKYLSGLLIAPTAPGADQPAQLAAPAPKHHA